MSVPIKSAGNRSGRELQALEAGLNGRSHRLHGQRFRETRYAFEQDVTICEQAEEQAINEIFLPDHHAADLLAQCRNPLAELLHFVRDLLR